METLADIIDEYKLINQLIKSTIRQTESEREREGKVIKGLSNYEMKLSTLIVVNYTID